MIRGGLALDVHQSLDAVAHLAQGLLHGGVLHIERGGTEVIREVIGHRVGQGEPAVNAGRKERISTQAVSAVIAPTGLTAHKKTGDAGHLVVVAPQAAHRKVGTGSNTHGTLVRVLARGVLVHLKKVAVTFVQHLDAQASFRIAEIQVDRVLERSNTVARFNLLTRRTRGNIARSQVGECRVLAL